ncbi:MAG: hypothetical protein E6R03_04755 [Hyphomicrobiaceae bacterium]|nr:MAG: hypothetical protein E6R03_04755 [Hyphomicrobiaceae bacterium]
MEDNYIDEEEQQEKQRASLTEEQREDTDRAEILAAGMEMIREAEKAAEDRYPKNDANWATYHGKSDTSHKKEGESVIFLHKTYLALEQLTAFFKGAFTNFSQYVTIETRSGLNLSAEQQDAFDTIFSPNLVSGLLQYHLDKAEFRLRLGDCWKVGLMEARSTIKIGSEMVEVPTFVLPAKHTLKKKTEKVWKLCLDVLGGRDYLVDPQEDTKYEIHRFVRDYDDLCDMAYSEDNPEGIYDEEALSQLQADADSENEVPKAENAGADGSSMTTEVSRRKKITVYEIWAKKVYSRDGRVMKVQLNGEDSYPLKNVMFSVAQNKLIQFPERNPHWHGESPFVSQPILRVPFAKWSKAIMDATTELNLDLCELFSLMMDGALNSVQQVRVVRADYLENEEDIEEGIEANTTLKVAAGTPNNVRVLETVQLGEVPASTMNFYNILDGVLAENSLLNQTRLGSTQGTGKLATEISQAGAAINSVLEGLGADFEEAFMTPLLEKCWMDILQNVDDFPVEELARLIEGDKNEVTAQLQRLNELSPQERFKIAGRGYRFKGVGIRTLMERMKDFQKLQQLLQTIATNPQLMNQFNLEYSMNSLLGKLLKTIGINPQEIQKTENEKQIEAKKQEIREQAMMQAELEQSGQRSKERGTSPQENATQGNASTGEVEPGAGQGSV